MSGEREFKGPWRWRTGVPMGVHAVGPQGGTSARGVHFEPPDVAGDSPGLGTWETPDMTPCPGGCGWSYMGKPTRCEGCAFAVLVRVQPILADYAHHPEVAAVCEEIKRVLAVPR